MSNENLPALSSTDRKVIGGGIIGATAAGAAIGSIVPGAGTVIGGAIGAIAGGIGTLVAIAIKNKK